MQTLIGKVGSQPRKTEGNLTFLLAREGEQPISVMSTVKWGGDVPERGDTVELSGDWPAEMNAAAREYPYFGFIELKKISKGDE